MVHSRVSVGCRACREKHTRCDGGRPKCQRCVRRGIDDCVYHDFGGFVFKEAKRATASARTPSSSSPDPSRHHQQQVGLVTASAALLQNDPAAVCLCFFFKTFLSGQDDPATSSGLFDRLEVSCARAAPDSSIMLATTYMSGVSASLCLRQSPERLWHSKALAAACRRLRMDLSSLDDVDHDQTLLAVLILDFADIILAMYSGTRPRIHCKGALTLVRQARLSTRAADRPSLAWTATHHALWPGLNGFAAAEVPSDHPLGEKSLALRLDRIFTLWRTASHFASCDMMHCASWLESELKTWHASLPRNWHPVSEIDMHSGIAYDRFPNTDIACVYNKWQCARLLVIQARRHCSIASEGRKYDKSNCPQNSSGYETDLLEIVNNVRRSFPFFLGANVEGASLQQEPVNGVFTVEFPSGSKGGSHAERFEGEILGHWHLIIVIACLTEIVQDNVKGTGQAGAASRVLLSLYRQLESVKCRFGGPGGRARCRENHERPLSP